MATPKQAIFASVIYKELKRLGYKVEIIAREETQTIDLLELLKTPYTKIGEYGGGTLEGKLAATLKREMELMKYFKEHGEPDVLWAHGSVSGIRVAYGLGVPIVCNNDTLHNEPVVRLTVPLVSYLIIPEAYKKVEWEKYGISRKRIIRFKGIEEVAWVKDLKTNRRKIMIKLFEKEVDKLVVVRSAEYKACYYRKGCFDLLEIIRKLTKHATIVYIPRYKEDGRIFMKEKNVIIPKEVIYTPELVGIADLVISSGGTMGREAALQGTPTISYHFWEAIMKYLARKRFPVMYIPDSSKLIEKSLQILRDPERYRVDTSKKLSKMESPIPIAVDCIKRCLQE